MKKFFFVVALLAVAATSTFAQAQVKTHKKKSAAKATTSATTAAAATTATATTKPEVVGGPNIKFETEVIDYGTIKKGADRERKFYFTNTGDAPLIIKTAVGSCGCTVPTYSKEPIGAGKRDAIVVNYDTQRIGAFTKTVTLTTNSLGMETRTLTIKGVVEDVTTAPAGTPATTGQK